MIVRKSLEEWGKNEDFKPVLKIIERANFDEIHDLKEKSQNYDSFICTIGTERSKGAE